MAHRLKRVEIIGFKSFADRTVLDFHPGITAIVGPNGCGKSNIADAIRWVLGEQSAKSMRGSKMDDVIFAGTSQRKPVNFAEVSIVFSNADGSFPIAYEEIVITRRIYRSGESEYLINRNPARLKDIYVLMTGSGVGKNAFSHFEQGKIDQVIQLAPHERRAIFEEAAGISRFLMEKNDAYRKLKNTEQNVERVLDIYEEVGKQLALCEKQAALAKEYKEKRAELEQIEKKTLVAKWNRYQQLWDEAQRKEEEGKERLKSSFEEWEGWQKKLQDAKKQSEDLEHRLRQKSEKLYERRSQKEIKTTESQSYAGRLQEQVSRKNNLTEEKQQIFHKKGSLQKEIAQSEREKQALEKEIAQSEEIVRQQKDHTQLLETEVAKLRNEQMKVQHERMRLMQEESHAESRLRQLQVRLEHLEERKKSLLDRKKKVLGLIAELEAHIANHEKKVELFQQQMESWQNELKFLVGEIKRLHTQVAQVRDQLERMRKEAAETQAREKVLKRLREDREGMSSATKHLLEQSLSPKSSFYRKIQPLYECVIIPEKDLRAAISTRFYTQTLAVVDMSDLVAVFAYAKEKGLKDFSLVCLADIGNSPEERLTHFSQKWKAAETLEQHLQESVDVISKDGFYIDSHRVIFHSHCGESNAFVREAELKTLQEQIEKRKIKEGETAKRLRELEQEREEIQKSHQEKERGLRQEEIKLVEIHVSLKREHKEGEQAKQNGEEIEEEFLKLQSEMAETERLIEEALHLVQSAKQNMNSSLQRHHIAEAELEKQSDILKNQLKHQKGEEASYRELLSRLQKLSYHLNLSGMKEEECQRQEERIDKEIAHCSQLQEHLQSLQEECTVLIAQADQHLGIIVQEVQETQGLVRSQQEKVSALESLGEKSREGIRKIEQQIYEAGIVKGQNSGLRDGIEKDLFEQFQIAMTEVQGMDFVEEIEAAEKRIRTLRRQLEGMGDVNLTAIEEWGRHKERHEFLTHQLEDLRRSQEKLVEIIANLDTESRKIFVETFAQIRVNFQKNFALLFQGGEADVTFTDDDVLNAGVEIMAKPPGKQMRSISLLSGGEKCLTALALLFAIFEVKPAPFSLLDEIDAPLDDSNVDRFVTVLQQFMDRCQFIVVTHNKRTMAVADRIYGVTMEQRGVSKMLSMEFQREEVIALV